MNVRLETINKLDLIRQLDTRMIHQKILSEPVTDSVEIQNLII